MKKNIIAMLTLSLLTLAGTPKGEKILTTKIVCDSVAMKEGISKCIRDFEVNSSQSTSYNKYYTKECIYQQRAIHCKKVKGIKYVKNGKEESWTPCDQVTSKKDKKLCE